MKDGENEDRISCCCQPWDARRQLVGYSGSPFILNVKPVG